MKLTEAAGTIVSGMRSRAVLIEREGKLFQTVQCTVKHAGMDGQGIVRVDGQEATRLKLRTGAQSLELPVPAVESERTVKVSVEVAGKTLATQSLTLKPVRKWVVYLLPHSHVDIGYTHVQTDVEKAQWKYLEMGIETARKLGEQSARLAVQVERGGALGGGQLLAASYSGETGRHFIDAVKAGQVGLQALYGNELTGLVPAGGIAAAGRLRADTLGNAAACPSSRR